jgi:hypothetical protein
MKYLKKAALIAGVSLVILITSCNRQRCYKCYSFGSFFLAIKGSDTIAVSCYLRTGFQDSVNRYLSLGYRLDTFAGGFGGYTPNPPNGGETCIDNDRWGDGPAFDSCVYIGK